MVFGIYRHLVAYFLKSINLLSFSCKFFKLIFTIGLNVMLANSNKNIYATYFSILPCRRIYLLSFYFRGHVPFIAVAM